MSHRRHHQRIKPPGHFPLLSAPSGMYVVCPLSRTEIHKASPPCKKATPPSRSGALLALPRVQSPQLPLSSTLQAPTAIWGSPPAQKLDLLHQPWRVPSLATAFHTRGPRLLWATRLTSLLDTTASSRESKDRLTRARARSIHTVSGTHASAIWPVGR